MQNKSTNFSFNYPLKQKVVRELRIVTEHVGELAIEGVGYYNPAGFDLFDRFNVDIDFVKWNGSDIKTVLEVTGGIEEIQEAAIRYFASQQDKKTVATAALTTTFKQSNKDYFTDQQEATMRWSDEEEARLQSLREEDEYSKVVPFRNPSKLVAK